MSPPSKIARALLIGIALLGCGRPPAAPPPMASPQRIVSMTPALTEILFALGEGDRVVGVTDFCTYPPEATTRPRIGGYANPSVEAVLALRPDLVVVSPGPGNREAALSLRRAGIRLEVVPAETLGQSFTAIEAVAKACGVSARGRELVARLRARIEAVRRRVAALPEVRTLFVVQVDPIVAAGTGTLPSDLLALVGGANVVDAPRYPRLGIESVAAARPELILQARMDVARPDPQNEIRFWKRWPEIPAVARGRVVLLPDDATLRPGPRVADAVEELAEIVHPEKAR